MLRSHLAAVEWHLLSISNIPANAGHTLHRGTPREAFIREFLVNHMSERVAIGSGEIIGATSQPRGRRNQFDIIIYKRDYPKLDFGGGINGFLVESVVATIEVKSILDKAGIEQSINAARAVKNLEPHVVRAFSTGYQPPSILNYVVAYDGPATMQTVHDWVIQVHQAQAIAIPALPQLGEQRLSIASPSIDGAFVLGKGFWYFDNTSVGLVNDQARAQHPQLKWIYADSPENNLLLLFLFLTFAVSGISGSWLNPLPYVQNINFGQVHWAG